MPSLTSCIKKAGKALSEQNRSALLARFNARTETGMAEEVARKIAADEQIAAAERELQPPPAESEEVRKAKEDLMAGLADLASLFSKNTRSNITEEQQQKLYPILVRVFDAAFRLGYLKFKEAAKYVLDQIRGALGDEAADAITLDHLQGAYIGMAGKYKDRGASDKKEVVAVEDLEEIRSYAPPVADNPIPEEPDDVPGPDTNLERDRRDADVADPDVGGDVQVEGPADGPQAPVGETGSRRRGRPDQQGVPDGGTAAGREPGDQPVHRGDGEGQPSLFDAGDRDGERSDDPGIAGVPPETVAADRVAETAVRGLDDAAKRAKQRAAESVPVTLGDLENIRETLPYLLEGQQEDVKKAEDRFAKPDGYGMLFTNGTGTGKTFTGLGIIKRFQRRGIVDQLIVVPDEKIMSDWVESGVPLGLTITPLGDTKDKGRGITITTYANLGQNIELVDRDWQHVVADEAHMLMQAADAKESLALDALRALTWHPRGAWRRFEMLHAEDLALKDSLEKRIESNNKIMNLDDTMDVLVDSLRRENEKLYAELNPLNAKLTAARNQLEAEYEQRTLERRPRATFLSATPFAYVPTVDWAEGYLFDYAEGFDDSRQGLYNAPNARQQFFIRHFGYKMKTGKLNQPDAKVDSGLMERQFNGWLKKRGVLSSRMLDVAADYDRRFVLVESKIGNAIDRAIDWIREQRAAFDQAEKERLKENPDADEEHNGYGYVQAEMDEYLFGKLGHLNRRYLLEAIKAKEVIPHIREHLALGRKIVVFHDFNKGGAINPFAFREKPMIEIDPNDPAEDREIQANANRMRVAYNAAAAHFHREFPELGGDLMAELMSPIARFTRDVPGVLIVNGTEKARDNLARYKQFNDDARGPVVLLVQSDKNKGWSGHDTTGKHQRVLFNLGLPTQPTKSIQQEGRIYRTGQVTNAPFRYLNTGTNWERWAFAQTIAERASTAENLGMGELARALKDAYISGFEESDDYRAGHAGEGTGGKERDRLANNAISEYDRAKSFYWGTQKKNSKTKAQEGNDYYATPEPVGLKMVQWSDTRGGEDSLEPSGGHGAIARWMGEKVNRTAIEPSNTLGSRLAMVFDGKIIRGSFEDHHIGNKYDTVVMNPPYNRPNGVGGTLAIEHLAKAADHLREWGRIVALVPDGPAFNQKFDKWFYEEVDRPSRPVFQSAAGPVHKGDTLVWNVFGHAGQEQSGLFVKRHSDGRVTAKKDGYESTFWENQIVGVQPGRRTEKYRPGEDLHLVAEIKLPGVTFERAGTQVRTRIVVIDKLPKDAQPNRANRKVDLSDIEDINELFDRLEDMEVAPRLKEEMPEIPEIAKKGPVALEELQELQSVARGAAEVYLGQAVTSFQAGAFAEAYEHVEAASRAWDYQPFRTQVAKLLPRLDAMAREAYRKKNAASAQDLEAAATEAGYKVFDYLTRKGKTLRVIEAPHLTRDQATEIEGAAWKPSSAKGFYVKVQNVPAMLAKYPPPAAGDGPMFARRTRVSEGRIRRTIDELVRLADENSSWRDWYEMHQKVVEELFGVDAQLFQKILSATSQMQTVKGNVTMALRAYEMMVTGQPFTGFLPAVAKNLNRIRAGEATAGPKISDFERGNLGDDEAMAVDRHIAQLLFNTSTPNRRQIDAAKAHIRTVAVQLGWTYKQAQAALWAANQVRKGVDPAKVVSYAAVLEQRADIINALHARLGTGGRRGVSARGATAEGAGEAGGPAFQRRRPALIDRISQQGITSADDLRDLLRMPNFGQWAETPLARDLDAAAALRDELRSAFPIGDWQAPGLSFEGIIGVRADWLAGTAAPGDLTRLAELADKYGAPVVVRGYFPEEVSGRGAAAVRYDEMRRAGFDIYRGIQDSRRSYGNAGVPGNAITWVRPGGGITLYTPMFDRGQPAPSEADLRKAGRLDRVNSVVDAITQAWAEPPTVRVVWSLQDPIVPARIRAEDARQRRGGASGSPAAVFDRGTVYIVASEAGGDLDIARSMFHEALGHAGLRAAFGQALKPLLSKLAATNYATVAAKAQEYGLDMANEADRLRAAEEVLAEMAETRPTSTWVQRAIAAIRTWLRQNVPTLFGKLELSDAEIIRDFILPARRAIERGAQSAGDVTVPAFARRAPFYSELVRAISRSPMNAGLPAAWKQLLAGMPQKGVKRDEIEWSGIEEWLDLQQGKLTKRDLSQYLEANGVQVQEEVFEENARKAQLMAERESLEGELRQAGYALSIEYGEPVLEALDVDTSYVWEDDQFVNDEGDPLPHEVNRAAERLGRIIGELEGIEDADDAPAAGGPQYNRLDLVLPGGTNYRELLLTLPAPLLDRKRELLEQQHAAAKRGDTQEVARLDALIDRAGAAAAGEGRYHSSHWDQPNILAHIRVNDRTDASGARVLFVEEIQSDWAQEGKKRGFKVSDAERAALRKEMDEATEALRKPSAGDAESERYSRAMDAYNSKVNDATIPTAPFVDKTDKWVSLALKRVIKMAVDGGYDRVAFITGAQSAERYDLSKQISKVEFERTSGGIGQAPTNLGPGMLYAYDMDGRRVVSEYLTDPEKAEDYVGKEVAKRLLEQPGQATRSAGIGARVRTLEGLDLKVGGEGMRAFYDKIVPAALKDVLRKVGGGAMETVEIGRRVDTPGMFDSEADAQAWIDSHRDVAPSAVPKYEGRYSKWSVREREGGAVLRLPEQPEMVQPGFTITPAMREKAAGGLPMFSRAAQTATEAFRAWFGNSKVVDAEGKPLVVYHATDRDFSMFDIDRGDLGAHFGTAQQAREIATYWEFKKKPGARTMPAYLAINNPLRLVDQGAWSAAAVVPQLQRIGILPSDIPPGNWTGFEGRKAVRRAIERAGYDGIVYANTREGEGDSYIAFRPEQIKSAIGNRGTYDPGDPNIMFSRNGLRSKVDRMTPDQIEQEIASLMPRVEHAYESGNAALAERLDARLEALMDAMEANLLEMQEDTLDRAYDGYNREVLKLEGEMGDTEADLVRDLANRWREITTPGSYEAPTHTTDAERAATLRALLEDYSWRHGGLKEDLSDQTIIEAAKDAADSVYGLQRAQRARLRMQEIADAPAFARRQHTPEQRAALKKAGIGGPRTVGQKIQAYLGRAMRLVRDPTGVWKEARQGALDQFFGIQNAVAREIGDLPADQSPYVAARLANGGTSSVMRAILLHGQARWARNGQHLEKIHGTEGLLDILKPLGDDLNDWFGWMIGNRAERLMGEGRENNFSDVDIRALQALATPQKLPQFREAARKYAAFKRSVLDVAEAAGLIDPDRRAVWDHADYIPFYREIDEKAIFSPTGRKGLAGQSSGIRMLRGGEDALNDPMENVLMNFSRLIDASLKNNAIRKTIEALRDTDAVHKVGYDMTAAIIPTSQVKTLLVEAGTPMPILQFIPESVFEGMARMWAIRAPDDPDVVRVMMGGKPTFWKINDPLLLRSLTSFVPFDFPGLGLMRGAKRLLTALVTATPEFWARNWIRDSVAAQAIARDNFNPWKSVEGIVRSYRESGAFEPMLFAGASFQAGNVNAGDPEATAIHVRRMLRQRGMSAASANAFVSSLIDTPAAFWDLYREIGEAVENANREAVYEAAAGRVVVNNGRRVSQLTQAAFEAKDLMDFSLRGSWAAYQLLADVVPFLNARVQGMYRLGRSDPRRLATVGMVLLAASLLLAWDNDGEDWYEALPDWDKDTYWHFRIGERHFRIPKPFELGVVFATIPERIGRSIKGLDGGNKTAARLWANVRDQLKFDPVPQLGRPVLDVMTNWDSFRDMPIEGMRDEGLPPVARFDSRTSDTARVVVDAIEPVANQIGLSPKRLEHLIGGYFGTIGLYALGVSDYLVRKAEGRPEGPTLRMDDLPVVRAFYREDPPRATVFESDLYKMREEADKLWRWLNATAQKDPARAREILEQDIAKLQARAIIVGAAKALSELNKARDEVMASQVLSPEEKRRRIDRIQEAKNLVAKRAVTNPAVRAAF